MKLMKFNMANCKVLHLDWSNPQYQYRLDDEMIESSPAENGLGEWTTNNVNQQCALTVPKALRILGCIKTMFSR